MEETIVAISTAMGTGAIGIVRMSGKDCFEILDKIFKPKNKEKEIKGYTIKYGIICEDNNIIDEVLVSYFINPNSYTRENMCEINTHGGLFVEKKILELCIKNGARIAEAGEFSKRAFLNGRMDLSQAEAVMDLINSRSEIEAKESVSQLEGSLSKKVKEIEEKIFDIITAIEVTIDFPEYDIEEIKDKNLLSDLNVVSKELQKLINTFENGKILKEGIKTVILGKPNAGKSSLLNAILNEDRAIVSSIEGTTRDTIEEYVNIRGIELKLIDTAGIRATENEIEKIGVDKAKKLANNADLVIAIFDISNKIDFEDNQIIEIIKNKNAIIILNKIDLINENTEMEEYLQKIGKPVIKISAKNSKGIDILYDVIVKMFNLGKIEANGKVVITNERHKEKIKKAKKNIDEAIIEVKENIPVDIITVYIKECLKNLGDIIGQNVSEEIINEIFKKFCLGK